MTVDVELRRTCRWKDGDKDGKVLEDERRGDEGAVLGYSGIEANGNCDVMEDVEEDGVFALARVASVRCCCCCCEEDINELFCPGKVSNLSCEGLLLLACEKACL